jgi:hypothetical protein
MYRFVYFSFLFGHARAGGHMPSKLQALGAGSGHMPSKPEVLGAGGFGDMGERVVGWRHAWGELENFLSSFCRRPSWVERLSSVLVRRSEQATSGLFGSIYHGAGSRTKIFRH